jgi:hypothetical protein
MLIGQMQKADETQMGRDILWSRGLAINRKAGQEISEGYCVFAHLWIRSTSFIIIKILFKVNNANRKRPEIEIQIHDELVKEIMNLIN